MVLPALTYGLADTLPSMLVEDVDRLESAHLAAARLISGCDRMTHRDDVLAAANLLPLRVMMRTSAAVQYEKRLRLPGTGGFEAAQQYTTKGCAAMVAAGASQAAGLRRYVRERP